MTDAEKMLERARSANRGRPEGTVETAAPKGRVVVTWWRASRLYEVGTEARVLATGRRAAVLPVLEGLLGEGGG